MKPFPFLMSLEASNICSVWVSAVFLVELFFLGFPSLLSLEFCIKEILQGLQPQQRPGLGTRGTRLGVRTSPTKAGDSEDVNHSPPSCDINPSPSLPVPLPFPRVHNSHVLGFFSWRCFLVFAHISLPCNHLFTCSATPVDWKLLPGSESYSSLDFWNLVHSRWSIDDKVTTLRCFSAIKRTKRKLPKTARPFYMPLWSQILERQSQ